MTSTEQPSMEVLVTARTLLQAATDPNTRLSVASLAHATGLTLDQVREVLASPTYAAIMEEAVKLKVGGLLTRGLDAMAEIIQHPSGNPTHKINAYRAVIATYDVMTRAAAMSKKDKTDDVAEEFKAAMDMLASLKGGGKTSGHANRPRITSDRSPAVEEDSD